MTHCRLMQCKGWTEGTRSSEILATVLNTIPSVFYIPYNEYHARYSGRFLSTLWMRSTRSGWTITLVEVSQLLPPRPLPSTSLPLAVFGGRSQHRHPNYGAIFVHLGSRIGIT